MAHELPKLPYDFAALEPHIDAQTMQIHHGKHHQAYVTNLNAALEKHPELHGKSIEELCRGHQHRCPKTSARRSATTAAATGTTACSGSGWPPTPAARRRARSPTRSTPRSAASTRSRNSGRKAGVGRFGSGWVWLINDGGKLSITSTPNQDNPLMEGKTRDPRPRRLGARLLPEVPEPPPGLHRRVVERRELGRGQQGVCRVPCLRRVLRFPVCPAGTGARSCGRPWRRAYN